MKKHPEVAVAFLCAFLTLPRPVAGETAGSPDRIVAARESVKCGDGVDVRILFDAGAEREVDLPTPLDLTERHLIFRRKNGGASPFIWLDAAKSLPESRLYIHQGRVVFLLKEVLLPPGEYAVSCVLPDAEGAAVEALCRPAEVLVEAPGLPFLEVLARRVIAANESVPADPNLMNVWHRMVMDIPEATPRALYGYLRNATHDRSRTGVEVRSEVIQALGKYYDVEFVEEFGVKRAEIPPAEIIKLLLEDKAPRTRYSYYMILAFMEDMIEDKDYDLLKKAVTRGMESKESQDIAGAYSAIVGNEKLRKWIGEDEIVRQITSNKHIEKSEAHFVLSYLHHKKGHPHPVTARDNEKE